MVPHQAIQVGTRGDELAESSAGWWERIELFNREPPLLVSAAEIRELLREFLHNLGLDGLVDSWPDLDIAGIKAHLPGVRGRDDDIAADEFAPVHVVAKGGREQADAVAALAENLVGLLEYRDASPFQVSRIDGDIVFFGDDLQPVIETANHDGADWAHSGDFFAFAFASFEPALRGFGHGEALRQREADGGVDADTSVGYFFDRRNPGTGDRDLHDHVGSDAAELLRLLHNGLGVPVESRVRLDGEAAVAAFVGIKSRLQQGRTPGRDFAHHLPGQLILSGRRHLFDQGVNSILPQTHLLLEHSQHNNRVTGRPNRSMFDGVGQLLN